jgi:hypothetical protein
LVVPLSALPNPVKLKYVAGTAVIVSCVPQLNTVPDGLTVMDPDPVTLVERVHAVPWTNVAVTVELVLSVMVWGLVLPVRAPLN